eukprot:3444673-Pyramimonas_sp.AAC.1
MPTGRDGVVELAPCPLFWTTDAGDDLGRELSTTGPDAIARRTRRRNVASPGKTPRGPQGQGGL